MKNIFFFFLMQKSFDKFRGPANTKISWSFHVSRLNKIPITRFADLMLDESICHFRGVGSILSLLLYF